MTTKDYVLIAKALASSRPRQASKRDLHAAKRLMGAATLRATIDPDQWERDRWSIAEALRTDNPRFDWERFMAATEE